MCIDRGLTIAVTGGKYFGEKIGDKESETCQDEISFIFEALDNIYLDYGIGRIIHGGEKGVDTLASTWATWIDIPVTMFPALWDDFSEPCVIKTNKNGNKYNALARPNRNQRMVDEGNIDLLVAFPGGRETVDMIDKARKAGINTIIVDGPSRYRPC